MKISAKHLVLIILVIFSGVMSYKVAYFVGEKYFWDRLFYQKSLVFGYDSRWDKEHLSNRNPRHKDLNVLVDNFNGENKKILGVTDDASYYKIAVIGDSYAYGQGVRYENRFSSIVEKNLNKIRSVKIYNLSHPGDTLIDNYTKFVLTEKTFNPDLYIITLLQNDLQFSDTGYYSYPSEQELLSELNQLCPGENVPEVLSDRPDLTWEEMVNEQYWPAYSSQYNNLCVANEIAKKIKSSGKKVFFFVFDGSPENENLNELDDVSRKNFIMTRTLSQIMKQNGLPIVESVFPPDFGSTSVSSMEGHPNSKTHQFYADLITKEILENPTWQFSN